MNIVNRVIVFCLGLLLFLGGGALFLLLSGVIVPQNNVLKDAFAAFRIWQAVSVARGNDANIVWGITLLVSLIGLVIVILELLPFGRLFGKRDETSFVVQNDTLGQVTVSRSMVRDLVQHEAEQVPGVMQAQPEVSSDANGLRISTRATVDRAIDLTAIGHELQERIRDVVQSHLGLPVTQVEIAARAAPQAPAKPRRVE